MIRVLSRAPLFWRAVITFFTPSFTASSEPSSQRYLRRMLAICVVVRRGSLRIVCGLSETSASLKFGGFGNGALANVFAYRTGGLAASLQVFGGLGVGGPPTCGAVYVSQRKNGWGCGARRFTNSTALRVRTSSL